MQNWILNVVEHYGYTGVALLILLENIFPPIPSEVILTFGGFVSTYTGLVPVLLIVSATVGSLLGAVILYGVGRLLSPEKLQRLLSGKAGRLLHVHPEDLQTALECFSKKGKRTVLVCRCVPIVRSLISIPAGMAKMPMGIFLIFTAFGTLVWNTVLIYAGVLAGASWEKIVGVCDTYSALVLVGICVGVVYLVTFLARRMRKEHH
jgi:membrane protein DedA with SNARE-associated domain